MQFLIPRGFAHGFAVLSETAILSYKCDNFYHPEADGGLMYNDPTLNIDWVFKYFTNLSVSRVADITTIRKSFRF